MDKKITKVTTALYNVPCSRPVTPGIGSSPPSDPELDKWLRKWKWVDGQKKGRQCSTAYVRDNI